MAVRISTSEFWLDTYIQTIAGPKYSIQLRAERDILFKTNKQKACPLQALSSLMIFCHKQESSEPSDMTPKPSSTQVHALLSSFIYPSLQVFIYPPPCRVASCQEAPDLITNHASLTPVPPRSHLGESSNHFFSTLGFLYRARFLYILWFLTILNVDKERSVEIN